MKPFMGLTVKKGVSLNYRIALPVSVCKNLGLARCERPKARLSLTIETG